MAPVGVVGITGAGDPLTPGITWRGPEMRGVGPFAHSVSGRLRSGAHPARLIFWHLLLERFEVVDQKLDHAGGAL